MPCPEPSPPAPLSQRPARQASGPELPAGLVKSSLASLRQLPPELGELVTHASLSYLNAPSWETFIKQQRGPSDLVEEVGEIQHPAAHFLARLRKGAPVRMKTRPWTQQQVDQCITRGAHASAQEYVDFLFEEFKDMMTKGQWTVLPADLVRQQAGLRVSPLGVVPQRERRPRTICDYTFHSVNADTVPLAPPEAMQFGKALLRVLQRIVDADPRFGPVFLAKLDISDGFYRIWLLPRDSMALGLAFPQQDGQPQLLAFPLALPMGWVLSPPYFCAVTETVADLANASMQDLQHAPPHRLENLAQTIPAPEAKSTVQLTPPQTPVAVPLPDRPWQRAPTSTSAPLNYVDVYVDDFLVAAQGNPNRLRQIHRVLFHALDQVMRGGQPSDPDERQEPASIKKLKKGDACWTTRKVILGWLIDTVSGTLELPPHRKDRLHAILDSIEPSQKRIAAKTWHQVLGELRSMALALPGGQGLFSTLQEAFRHPESVTGRRLRLNRNIHAFLRDFKWLARDITARPTRLTEIIKRDDFILGTTDAAGPGMGGVFFVPSSHVGRTHASYLWRSPFPDSITRRLVTWDNPSGTLTNSDLELAGAVTHLDVMAQTADVRERTVTTLHDNTATVFWQHKGSVSASNAAAYLLRVKALHQRFHRYIAHQDYIPGPVNAMADDCSRLWHLSDTELLSYFDSHYPQPTPWQLCHPRTAMLSAVTSALCKTRSEPESFLHAPMPQHNTGHVGWPFVPRTTWIRGSQKWKTPFLSSRSSGRNIAMDAWPHAVTPSDLVQWRTPYVRWARRSPAWGPGTSARTAQVPSIFGSNDSFDPTLGSIRLHTAFDQSRYRLSNML